MITIALCAILCGICTVYLIAPISRTRPKLTYSLMVLIPLVALGLYLLLGAPVY